jgi:phosphomannomutase
VRFGTSGARGLVKSMSNEVCYAYTAAFLRALGRPGTGTVVLGHDLRPSSPRIAAACAAAVADAGGELAYVGALPTPAVAFYARQLNAPAVVVTGSHIPFDRNGIKFYRPEGEISKSDELAIQAAVVDVPEAVVGRSLPSADSQAAACYAQRYVSFLGKDALAGMCVAVYEHSSVARDVLPSIMQALGARVISLGRTDTFVPIDTEAVRPEDVAQAQVWARQYAFDAIVSTDGDADRPLIGDERGQWLRGDLAGVLCAKYLAADVVVTPVSSNTAVETCGCFRRVVRTRIGSPYVIAEMEREAMRSSGVVVGYEANGGFLLGSELVRNGRGLGALPTRDAVLPILAVLAMAHERGCRVSALGADLPARYTASDRLQSFPTEKSAALIASLRQDLMHAARVLAPSAGEIVHTDETDGFRATFANGDIVHLRPSGNAPELRCYAEADTPGAAQSLCDGCLERCRE